MYGLQVWGLNKEWKELSKVHSGSCNKLMGVSNCAVSGFARWRLAEYEGQGHSTDCKVLVSDYAFICRRSGTTI